MTAPSFSTYFESHLATKLASLPDDRARVRMLAQQHGVWAHNYRMFANFGAQPYTAPHPELGWMVAIDFANVLAIINGKRGEIERKALVPA
jgi:hypothetical protein